MQTGLPWLATESAINAVFYRLVCISGEDGETGVNRSKTPVAGVSDTRLESHWTLTGPASRDRIQRTTGKQRPAGINQMANEPDPPPPPRPPPPVIPTPDHVPYRRSVPDDQPMHRPIYPIERPPPPPPAED